ncbi:MAG: FAD:protein transferase [Actinomycetota bacterium]|nr:FAD:protein transferase [Actinomycetota bacterium]
MTDRLFIERFPALGTTVLVAVARAGDLAVACRIVESQVEELDRACSRFRADSELSRVNAAGGLPTPIGPLLSTALEVALEAAALTDGLVDPTVAAAMEANGYDCDFASIQDNGSSKLEVAPAPGWRSVQMDRKRQTVQLPPTVCLDLGATAKALGADLAAAEAARACREGVLVSFGGDIAVGGPPPPEGWPVLVTDDHKSLNGNGQNVTLYDGGLATSSITVRRWTRNGANLHHILDPTTGRPAPAVWRTVSVAASSCVQANIASTAAVIMGERAPRWLASHRLPARLVRTDGRVALVAEWPDEEQCHS